MNDTYRLFTICTLCLIAALAISPVSAMADPQQPTSKRPTDDKGIYIHLTEDFYRALQENDQQGSRTLSTSMSENYLKQIAIAARYTVETNLAILKQQERIIQLLEAQTDNK